MIEITAFYELLCTGVWLYEDVGGYMEKDGREN